MQKKSSSKSTMSKNVLNVVRTTQRNNIDLKHIADNKANILMSINAIMIAFLIPIVLSNIEIIVQRFLYIPLVIFAATCIITIVFSASVLRPFSARGRVLGELTKNREKSPFFFENYDNMDSKTYYDYFCTVSNDEESFFKYVIEDLHYYGKILSLKYKQIKYAYNAFIIGLILTVVSLITVIFI